MRALPKGFANSRAAEAILVSVKAGLDMDHKALPQPESGREEASEQAQAATEILKLALKIVCGREGIAPKLVANSTDIEAVAEDDSADVPLMHGWRREVFGDLALAIKHGRAMIGFRDGRVVIVTAAAYASEAAAEQ